MRPIYIDVPVYIDAEALAQLQRIYRSEGWSSTFHQACRAALNHGTTHIDNETITRLGKEIWWRGDPGGAPRSYDPADVGSRFD